MTLAALCYAVAAVASGAFAASLLHARIPRSENSAARLTFVVAIAVSAAWAAAGFATQLTGAGPWSFAAGVADLGRYAAWLLFTLILIRPALPASGSRLNLVVVAGACAVAALVIVLLASLSSNGSGMFARNASLASLALPVLGLVLVEQLFRNASDESRWATKPLCLGLACVFVFDVYLHSHVLLFGQFDAESVTVRPLVHALALPFLYVATKRHADWTGSLRISRDAAFHTATLMLVGVYLLAISAIGYYVRNAGGDWGRALELTVLCIALALLATLLWSASWRAKLRVFVGKNFFRYRYDYRAEWLRLTSRLTTTSSPRDVGVLVIRGVAELLHCQSGALWYRNASGDRLVQAARWNMSASDQSEPCDSPFVRYMGEREWVFDLDAFRKGSARQEGPPPPQWLLDESRCWVAVPLIVGDQLTGLVVIGRPYAVVHINWEVRDLLKTASRQAAGFLALMHATDALLEARKFEAFNRMSAFVVHDLKNIVAQLSLMMQNAQRLKGNTEFQQDMLTTVENSLDRMRRLMLQLRSGEAPAGVPAGVALTAIFERIRAAAAARGRTVELCLEEPVATRGHADRIERVLGHIVDNALDATAATGAVTVTLGREGSHAKIVVRDTGQGMSAEFMNRQLFKPFQSSKVNGMGIGAYESRQYIQEIGGNLSVKSEVGQGTVITVLLPLLDTAGGTLHELHRSNAQ